MSFPLLLSFVAMHAMLPLVLFVCRQAGPQAGMHALICSTRRMIEEFLSAKCAGQPFLAMKYNAYVEC